MVYNLSYNRILQKPPQSFFLFGVRGVGKSTWAKREFSQAVHFDLLDEALYQSYLRSPGLFAGELNRLPAESWVIVDEIQRLPNLLNEVHRFIENKGLRFVILGSSARKLKTAGTNLLAGRALRYTLYPFLPPELGDDYVIDDALKHGTIPVIFTSPDRSAALNAYVSMYLTEEIKAEALVRNLPAFSRFLPVAALYHAQTININAIARDAQIPRTTIEGYLQILEDTLLTFTLPAYQPKLKVRERKFPKLYWVDPGVVRAVKGQVGQVAIEEKGSLFEGLIAVMLKAYEQHNPAFRILGYWATTSSSPAEVDFLVETDKGIIALEVKSASQYNTSMLSGLRHVSNLKGLYKRVLVANIDRPILTNDGIDVMPFDVFSDWLWSGAG